MGFSLFGSESKEESTINETTTTGSYNVTNVRDIGLTGPTALKLARVIGNAHSAARRIESDNYRELLAAAQHTSPTGTLKVLGDQLVAGVSGAPDAYFGRGRSNVGLILVAAAVVLLLYRRR